MKKYYFDTSIWLDFFENRNEPNLPKGDWAKELLNKTTRNNDRIVYSDNNIYELNILGYSFREIDTMFLPFKPILIFVESTEKQIGKAKDLAMKRDIPKRDALHAFIASDNKAILVTLDRHFRKLLDIIKPKSPKNLI